MKKIIIFISLIFLSISCSENTSNTGKCTLADLNMHKHPDTLLLVNIKLVTLPNCIGDMTNLKVVSLFNNEITAIPKEFFNLKDLFYFVSVDNKLDVLPDDFDKLTALRYIIIENTKLSEIPKSIFESTNLLNLQFIKSPISSIPDEIGNMTNLNRLVLNGTNITELPESIKNLKDCLKQLEIVDTKIPKSHFELIKSWLPNTEISYNY